MRKLLITGFEPFDGETINPSMEAVRCLPDRIGEYEIIKRELPVVFGKAGDVLREAIDAENPDVVICVGQAGGRTGISIERIAINLTDARIPDNEGNQPEDQIICEDGETAYLSTLPVKAMVQRLKDAGIPAGLSYSAGTFVCNETMYRLLYMIKRYWPDKKGGFIHVPYSEEQMHSKPEGTPAMPQDMITKALQLCIEAL